MRQITSVAVLAILAALAGCGGGAGAGETWIFYSWEQTTTSSAGKTTRTMNEAINIKAISTASYSDKGPNDKPVLSLMVSGREVALYGDDAAAVWKSMKKNN